MNRILRRTPIVISLRIHRRAITIDVPVAVQREGQECGGPVSAGEDPTDCAPLNRASGQIGAILPTPSRSLHRLRWWIQWGEPSAHPTGTQRSVQFSYGIRDLFTRLYVILGFAFRVS